MADVYHMDRNGAFVGLRDISRAQFQSIPRCPDCQSPIRQFVTSRYNRVVNRAVIDQTSKRFLVSGKERLQDLEKEASRLELDFDSSREELLKTISTAPSGHLNSPSWVKIGKALKERRGKHGKLSGSISSFVNRVSDKDQPVRKLHDATVKALRAASSIDECMEQLSIIGFPVTSRDQRIVLGSRAMQLKTDHIFIVDQLEVLRKLTVVSENAAAAALLATSESSVLELTHAFLKSCKDFITECGAGNLPKLNVEARLYYARVASLFQSYTFVSKNDDAKTKEYIQCAKDLLQEAKRLCDSGFQTADALQAATERALEVLGKAWYEPVSEAEVAAIKAAMVSGPDGMATHSGHWYNCENGHPVSRESIALAGFSLLPEADNL